jgi:drug/metabolite transporter (DMT)-like permease
LSSNKSVELSLLLVALIWALNFTVVKATLTQIDPMSFNAFRFMMAIVFMLFVILKRGEKIVVHKGDWPKIIMLGLLGNLVYQFLFIYGINFTFAANAAVMLGTIPVWIAVVGHFFFGERLTRIKLLGILFAFGGVALIMEGSEKGITLASETIVGDLIILLSASVFGIYTLFSKKMLSRYTPIQFTTLMMLTGGTALIVAGLPWVVTLDYSGITLAGWGGVFFSGFLSIGLSYVIWNYGV